MTNNQTSPVVTLIIFTFGLSGCAYRMSAPVVVQQHMMILTPTPERLVVRVGSAEHLVGADGKVEFPMMVRPRFCRVYLFNKIPTRGVPDYTDQKIVEIVRGSDVVRRLSIRDLRLMRTDATGRYQIDLGPTQAK